MGTIGYTHTSLLNLLKERYKDSVLCKLPVGTKVIFKHGRKTLRGVLIMNEPWNVTVQLGDGGIYAVVPYSAGGTDPKVDTTAYTKLELEVLFGETKKATKNRARKNRHKSVAKPRCRRRRAVDGQLR